MVLSFAPMFRYGMNRSVYARFKYFDTGLFIVKSRSVVIRSVGMDLVKRVVC